MKKIWVYGRVTDQPWLREASRSGIEIVHRSIEELSAQAGSESHQGVVAEVEPYRYAAIEPILAQPDGLIVALDQVQDPHNLGAVARVAESAGVAGLVLTRRRSVAVTAAVCSASAGAVEHLKIAQVENMADFLLKAKQDGRWVYGAAAGSDLVYTEVDMRGPTVLVLGAEDRGLRPRVARSCDALVSILLAGRVGSLNLSTAAAVLVFEAVRQR